MTHPPDNDPRIQVNVRLRRSLRDTIDTRRARLGLSRDEWMTRALTWALQQPDPTDHPMNRSTDT